MGDSGGKVHAGCREGFLKPSLVARHDLLGGARPGAVLAHVLAHALPPLLGSHGELLVARLVVATHVLDLKGGTVETKPTFNFQNSKLLNKI